MTSTGGRIQNDLVSTGRRLDGTDYRIEFEGQVDLKGLGWVFRAADPKNYYAYKIELVRTGSDPGAALTHFAMVKGARQFAEAL